MAKLRAIDIQPEGATTNLTLGASGDTVTISSTEVRANTFKDAGGNTLWTSNGSGTLSSVNSGLAGGGWTHLLTQNGDGSSSSLEFSSTYITSAYDLYAVVIDGYYPVTNSRSLECNFSIDNGSNWKEKTTAFWKAYINNAGTDYGIQTEQSWSVGSSQNWFELEHDCGGDYANGENGSGILYLWTPSNTTYMKKFMWRGFSWRSNSYIEDSMLEGRVETASAVNCIGFRSSNPYTLYGTFKLYGVT